MERVSFFLQTNHFKKLRLLTFEIPTRLLFKKRGNAPKNLSSPFFSVLSMMISEPTPFSHSFNFNDIQRVHPLSSSPQYSNTLSSIQQTTSSDDVTTIFVVGFPEDMAEREFQNMFTFCPGFEAASLKWHCKDQDDDTGVPSNGGKKQMV